MQDIDRYIDEHAASYISNLQALVRQRSIAAHAPNENIYVANYIRGIKHIRRIMERFAEG